MGDKGSREKDGRQESYICRVKINLSASDLGHCSRCVERTGGEGKEMDEKRKRRGNVNVNNTVKIQMHMWT